MDKGDQTKHSKGDKPLTFPCFLANGHVQLKKGVIFD